MTEHHEDTMGTPDHTIGELLVELLQSAQGILSQQCTSECSRS